MDLQPDIEKGNCLSCGAVLFGPYCSQCGEKKLNSAKDFRLIKFIEQTVDGFTHFDSKFLKSFKLLIFRPGFLTLEYLTGRRIKYMKPIQIFLIISLIFYFIFPHSSAYYTDVSEMNHGFVTNNRFENTFQYNFLSELNSKAQINKATFNSTIHEFRIAASDKAKEFFFLLIPIFAFFLLLQFRNIYKYYMQHIIFALHSLSSFLLLDLIYIKLLFLSGIDSIGDWLILPLIVLYGVHLFFSLKLVYKTSLVTSIIRTFITLILFLITILIYRQVVTIATLNFL